MRTFPKIIGLLLAALLLTSACSGGDEDPVEVGQAGSRPTETTAATTTTTSEQTTTTLAPAIVEIPPVPEWAASWSGPSEVRVPGTIEMQAFNDFVLENAPDNVEDEVAISAYLKLDPADPNIQMLSGQSGGPEATNIVVIVNVQDDDSVRAYRYDFVVERRSRDFAQIDEEEGAEAETGDTDEADDELDTNEGDAATEEDVKVVEGAEGIPWVLSGQLTVQCQPGRGHQDFTVELCV